MAFNPFHAFRKHQRVLFAIMVVVAMFMFVLSSGVGRGDILSQIGDWFSNRGPRAEAGISLDGRKIDGMVIESVRRQRMLADRWTTMAVDAAYSTLTATIFRRAEKADPQLQELVRTFASLPQRAQILHFSADQYVSAMSRTLNDVRVARLGLNASTAPNKSEQIDLADSLYTLIDRELTRLQKMILHGRQSYFGGDNTSQDDTLDFMVWEKEANRLGIQMSNEDLRGAVQTELLHQTLSKEQSSQIHEMLLREFPNYDIPKLNAALIAEFRVRSAKTALLGEPSYTRTTYPVSATPDELFDWFRDARTAIRVGLVQLPVADFVAKVNETPTDEQLKDLFKKYRNDEYNPEVERPGFKDPRKVKVDWFIAPADSDYYKTAAKREQVCQALWQLGAAPASADGSPACPLGCLLAANAETMGRSLDKMYRDHLQGDASWFNPYAFGLRGGLHDASVLRPEVLAALVGGSVASGVTGAGPFAGPLAMEGLAIDRECRDRARLGAAEILTAALDPAPLAVDAAAISDMPKPPSFAAMRDILLARQREQMLQQLMKDDLDKFRAEVAKRSSDPKQDRKTIDAYINEFIAARKFQRGGTAQPDDRYALSTDPGLAPVRDGLKVTKEMDPTGEVFATFAADGPSNPFGGINPTPTNFRVQLLAREDATYAVWRSEDLEPRPVTFDQAKPRVVQAWKWEKARALANAEAEKLAVQLRGKNDLELRDAALRTNGRKLIELAPMAKWNSNRDFVGGNGTRYEPPTVPLEKVTFPGDMASSLVDMRSQPAGSTKVVFDVPKANYFVAAILSKDEPSADAFRMAYKDSMNAIMRDTLFDIFYGERYGQYRKGMMKQLREDWRLVITKADAKPSNKDDTTE